MTFGLQTWGPNGEPDVEVSRRLTRYLGRLTTGTSSGSLDIGSGVPAGSTFWIFVLDAVPASLNDRPPEIQLSGSVVTWSFGGSTNRRSTIVFYGVY